MEERINKPILTLDSTYDELLSALPEGRLRTMLAEDKRKENINTVREVMVWIIPTMGKPTRERFYKFLSEHGLDALVASKRIEPQL